MKEVQNENIDLYYYPNKRQGFDLVTIVPVSLSSQLNEDTHLTVNDYGTILRLVDDNLEDKRDLHLGKPGRIVTEQRREDTIDDFRQGVNQRNVLRGPRGRYIFCQQKNPKITY